MQTPILRLIARTASHSLHSKLQMGTQAETNMHDSAHKHPSNTRSDRFHEALRAVYSAELALGPPPPEGPSEVYAKPAACLAATRCLSSLSLSVAEDANT